MPESDPIVSSYESVVGDPAELGGTPQQFVDAQPVPKLFVPLQMGAEGGLKTVEQDSEQEIAQCVYAILATERGSRIEEPEFGIADPTFEQGGMDLGEALLATSTWEPRAEVRSEQEIEDLIADVVFETRPA